MHCMLCNLIYKLKKKNLKIGSDPINIALPKPDAVTIQLNEKM